MLDEVRMNHVERSIPSLRMLQLSVPMKQLLCTIGTISE